MRWPKEWPGVRVSGVVYEVIGNGHAIGHAIDPGIRSVLFLRNPASSVGTIYDRLVWPDDPLVHPLTPFAAELLAAARGTR